MKKRVLSTILIHLLAWTIGLMWMVPFVGLFMASIRPYSEIIYGWWNISPFTPTISNYVRAWNYPSFPLARGMLNSILVAIPATVIPIFFAALGGYGFARFSLPMKNYLFLIIVVLLSLPQQMVAIPLFSMLKAAKLLDTYLGLIIINTAWGIPWILFFMRNYFSTLPVEIEEAARVDGASDFVVFYKIILPVSVPALISAAALQFVWVWSDLFFPLIVIFSPEKMTAIQRLPLMQGRYLVDWELLSAASVMVSLVPIAVFACLQRYYIRGMIGWVSK